VPKLLLTLVLLSQVALYYRVSSTRAVPLTRPIAEFPAQLNDWRISGSFTLDPGAADSLGADAYLSRDYRKPVGPSVNLFVAYFASQSASHTPHSPQNCLPGSGWIWVLSDTIPFSAGGADVHRYVVTKGGDQALVLYWYQWQDGVIAGELQSAVSGAWRAFRDRRTEVALVRVVAPIGRGESISQATTIAADFARAALPALHQFLPN
jgi:EpsI family protein